MIDETLFDAEEKMEKAVAVARDDLASIRTGRANPGMFNRITVDYYGASTPITSLKITVKNNAAGTPAEVGSNASADVSRDVIEVEGSFTSMLRSWLAS